MKTILFRSAFLAVMCFGVSAFVAPDRTIEKITVLQGPTGTIELDDPPCVTTTPKAIRLILKDASGTRPSTLRKILNGVDAGAFTGTGDVHFQVPTGTTSVSFTYKSGGSTVLYAGRFLSVGLCQ